MALQITGVRKDRYGVITNLCGLNLNGSSWSDTVEGIINDINTRKYSYYVLVNGAQADVYVVPATSYHKAFLKTTADTTTRNNLDNLDWC